MQSVSNEDELVKRVAKNQRWSGFSKVSQISTSKISPDIDFLLIDEAHKETVGYEFKLLRFRKDWKRVNMMPLYTGLGEAIQYFRFGVDKSYLVLGISKETPTDANVLGDIHKCVFPLSALAVVGGGSCLGVCVWDERLDNFDIVLDATGCFFMADGVKHLKECLLRGQFRYHKEFKFGFHNNAGAQ